MCSVTGAEPRLLHPFGIHYNAPLISSFVEDHSCWQELATAIRVIELDQYSVGVEHVDAAHFPIGVQE
jgi:hypothetical protein